MDKIIELGPYFENTYEPVFQIVDPNAKHVKIASEAMQYIKEVQPKEGKTIILVIAMGAGDTYGCFLPGSKVLMEDGTEKNIEEVQTGDLIRTHLNNAKKVIAPLSKFWEGDLYTFKFRSYGHDLVCTQEHPIYGVKKENIIESRKLYYKQKETYLEFINKLSYDFIDANKLNIGDYVAIPYEKNTEINEELGDNDFAFLMGYYLGNGCGAKEYRKECVNTYGTYKKTIFILPSNDVKTLSYLSNIIQNTGYASNIFESYHNENSIRIEYGNKSFIQLCEKHLGMGAHNKFISSSIMKMPREWQYRFLAGYLQADGCQVYRPETRYHGELTSSTVSRKLTQDLVKLCARLGYHSSSFAFKQHHSCTKSAGNIIYENKYESSLISKLGETRFFCSENIKSNYASYLDTKNGYILIPIKGIDTRPIHTEVFNLEVEDDNSYCVNSIATHNSNRNGDYFPRKDLKLNYKNFETTFDDKGKINGGALIFKHHKNKLNQGHPWYGIVRKAFYNDRMDRVELLLEVDNEKAPDIIEKIKNGEDVAVSMGVKIPYDICSLKECSKKSPRVSEYCDHLKYDMGTILPDGRKIYAINGEYDYNEHKKPLNFFDISFVFRPADQTGYMLKKVANHSCQGPVVGSAFLAEKYARESKIAEDLKKLSVLYKYVRGDVSALKEDDGSLKLIDKFRKNGLDNIVAKMEPLSSEKIDALSKYPMNEVLSTLSKANIILTTPEFVQLIIKKLAGIDVPKRVLEMIASLQAEIFEDLSENPEKVEEFSSLPMFNEVSSNPNIEKIIEDIKDNRDTSDEGLLKKADVQLLRSALDVGTMFPTSPLAKGMTQTETYIDPMGRTYMASRDAIEEAQFWEMIQRVTADFGTSLALAGTYALLRNRQNKPAKVIAPIALLSSALMAAKGVKDYLGRDEIGDIVTQSGERIPSGTIMMEKKNAFLSPRTVGLVTIPVAATSLLSRYYKNKINDGTVGYPETPLDAKMENLARHAYHSPFLLTGGMMASGALGLKAKDKLLPLAIKAKNKMGPIISEKMDKLKNLKNLRKTT